MRDLTAQVTSSLLPFPRVTIDALGEDEITLDSVLHGRFTVGRSGLAWLACGPHLEVVHALTGERLSAYCFSGGGENPPSVLAVRDFSWLKRSGLLVGLEEVEGSVLCLYDLGLSRVVKAVVIPGRITAIEPLVSYGGASTSTQHLHQSLRWFFGIAAVVTDLGHVLLVDLCLDDLSCSQSELEASDLQVVTKSPGEIPRLREVSTRQGRHLCLQLNGPSGGGVGVTALQYIPRTNQLAVGFSDGYLQLWNLKTLKKEYHSQLEGGRVPVYAFTFQEPENDPRNCCYLWAIQSAQELEGDMVSLHLLQLAFSERKCSASGKILYEGLEYCEERYSQELSSSVFPLRAQATNTRLLSCQTIEKFRPHPDRDDSMNEVASPDTSVSVFSWQVKAYGQGTLSTYIGVFDINRWYHAQMPDSLRTGESLQNCPYLAVWSLDSVVQMVSSHVLLDVVVHDRSLSRGLPFTCPPPEQYFNPTTYNFDATCLLNSGMVHLTCSGYQKETLSFLKKAAPCSSDIISSSYSRCLMSGLLSSRLADTQASSLSQEEQLDAILSTAVETSSLGLITGCIKQWTAEEQPGSALNLRYILDWAWNKVIQTKEELDGICAPLFDSLSNFTDPQTMQLLQHSQRLLSNLSTIFHCLLNEAHELTQKGLVGLINKNMVSSLISKYAQVVLWFCRTGLLPEGSDYDTLQISRPFYTHSVISNYYTIRREELTRLAKGKLCADCLMIDGLVAQCGERLSSLWKRDDGGTGLYPPPTLHALLDIYLLDNIEDTAKHAIVIYLLLDVMYSFPNKEGASVESFPTAFSIPIGLVKLIQGLWLLDHNDHQSSFELLLHPAASQCQFEWQHERVLQALMCQGQHSLALRYFHITKPPISSTSQAKLSLSVLLQNRCLIEAWSLLRKHSNHLNMSELLGFLYESCQELGLIKELLKLPLGLGEQECLEKFLQGTGGLQNRELLMIHYLQQANYIPALQLNHTLKMNLVNERDPKLKERSSTRNSILDQYGKVLPRVQRKLAVERAKPYQHPYAVHREVSRPQPLSTITKRSASEKVMSRAGFINNVLLKIEEVWLGKGSTPQSSPAKSPQAAEVQSPKPSLALPVPFLGTPITMTSKRKSRLMDLVVQPSCQTTRSMLSPPRLPSSWMSPKSVSKAPELSLLQTPQVVKRARALAASGPVFTAFTPQSILRSSLRPTPVATPSASPGRSITPPLRSKESRITFIEEESSELEKSIRWTNGMAGDNEISLLARVSTPSKPTHTTWSLQAAEHQEGNKDDGDKEVEMPSVFMPPEGGVPSPQLQCFEEESLTIHKVSAAETQLDAAQPKLNLSLETSQMTVRSTDTTLEYFDAPLTEEQEGEEDGVTAVKDEEVVTINITVQAEKEEPEKSSPTSDEIPLITSEDVEKEEEEAKEEETSEVLETGLEQETTSFPSEMMGEQDPDLSTKQDATLADQVNISKNIQVCDQVTVNTDFRLEEEQVMAAEHDILSETAEATGVLQHLNSNEATEPTEEDELEQTDLTDFVQRHLFDSNLSPPLTRSGIHSASQTLASFNSATQDESEEEEPVAAAAAPVFTGQNSAASVTSSDPTGTDSHSVVSLNDSDELSTSSSEEEEDDDEEEEAEDEEDSGSEVEIIEEVQGNGRLPPLQPSSVFEQPGLSHFLPSITEQQAAELSLMTPSTEIKMVEEEMEGNVVMVTLGAEGGVETLDEQGASFMELKPSATLLVPMELMEGHENLVGCSQLHQVAVQDGPTCESQSSLSLMLDVEDEFKEAEMPPLNDGLVLSMPPTLSPAVEDGDEPVAKSEVILLSPEAQDAPVLSEECELEQREEADVADVEDAPADLVSVQILSTDSNHEPEDIKTTLDEEVTEDEEPTGLLMSEESPQQELPEDMVESVAGDEERGLDDEKPETEALHNEPQKNGPVDIHKDIPSISEEGSAAVEKDDHETFEIEGDSEDIKTDTEKNTFVGRQEEAVSDEQVVEEPVEEAPVSPNKTSIPSTPTRRTRGKSVIFISPLTEQKEEPEEEEDKKLAESQSAVVPPSPRRTPRKSKQNKEPAATPRRSTRRAQQEPPEEEKPVDAIEQDAAAFSNLSSPGRRRVSQRTSSTRSNQSGNQESSDTELGVREDDVAGSRASRRSSSKTPTPSKRRTTQSSTPRRSSRRVLGSTDLVSIPLEIVKEETEQDEVFASPVKHTSKKSKAGAAEVQPVVVEEEERKVPASSPGRTTRRSSRNSATVYSQSTKKAKRETVNEASKEDEIVQEPKSNRSSLQPRRGKLWDHPEEALPILTTPLEVDSETPVADALIKRLQDEEGLIKTKGSTKPSEQISSVLPVKEDPDPEDDDTSPGEHSFIYSPSRRSRAKKMVSSELGESAAPVTRSRRRVALDASVITHEETASEEDQVEVDKAAGDSKTRKPSKRTVKSRTIVEPLPLAEVDLISPLPSPADPVPRVQKRAKGEAPATSTMNLRRKRIMEAVFTKPVTRRKKL
ncbi:protein ELYS isoform X2 [Takifugu rubripes]|uniref:AT hook containing transcription factor 1 n=1 Tax=Takifugu rubripes TaxID=31033 RepID=A0A3B5K5R9_TAKRU|nr:protein ELYS isoform X2 [Takifugu rubripes]